MGYVMAFAHTDAAGDTHMKVDIKTQAHFSHVTFFDLTDAGPFLCCRLHAAHDFGRRGPVHDFVVSPPGKDDAIRRDQRASKESRPIVSAFPARPADQS